jgi:hypothetical protein
MKWWWLFLCGVAAAAAQTPGPTQPIPFSHRQHAGTLKLKCNMCHPNRDPGESMGIAQAATCMQCHSSVKTDSPAIQKLAGYAESRRAIPWVRLYQIPAYVFFSHRAHLETGNTCRECHGPAEERSTMAREVDLSMTGCMNCHKEKNASNDCLYCHEQRQ